MFLKELCLINLLIIYYRGRKLDKERFMAIQIHQKYNVPNRGRDKGAIARNTQSNKRKGKILNLH